MPPERVPDLGPLEFSLLGILWQRGSATAGELLEDYNAAAGRPLAYTTVSTLLTRMAEKGVVEVDKGRQPYRFTPAVGREQVLRQRVRDFVGTFFGGRMFDLAVRLVEDEPPTEESIRQLEAILEKHKAARRKRARKGGRGG